jgi:hypothetical protein
LAQPLLVLAIICRGSAFSLARRELAVNPVIMVQCVALAVVIEKPAKRCFASRSV